MKRRGMSLLISLALVTILFLLAVVSINTVNSNARLRGNIYAKTVSFNAAETGIHEASPGVINDAADSFINILDPDNEANLYQPREDLAYMLNTFSADFEVTFEDNDDLDGDPLVDTDKRIIIRSTGRMRSLLSPGQTGLQVLSRYTGAAEEYAQATGGSKSNSNFSSEINVSGNAQEVVTVNPNN